MDFDKQKEGQIQASRVHKSHSQTFPYILSNAVYSTTLQNTSICSNVFLNFSELNLQTPDGSPLYKHVAHRPQEFRIHLDCTVTLLVKLNKYS